MSRHTVPCLYSGFTVVVGWDNPLSTFFAQVSRDDAGEDDDPLVLWLGTEPHQIIFPRDLIAPLAPYATIADATIVMRQSPAHDGKRR